MRILALLSQREAEDIVKQALHKGKAVCPDRFPRINPQVITAWTDVLRTVELPAEVWSAAVDRWVLFKTGERMITPRDLRETAFEVINQWDTDPAWSPLLTEWRRERQELRDRRIAAGLPPNQRRLTSTTLHQTQPAPIDVPRIVARHDQKERDHDTTDTAQSERTRHNRPRGLSA